MHALSRMEQRAGPFKESVGKAEEIEKDAFLLSSCFPACGLLTHDFALALLFHWEEEAETEHTVPTQDSRSTGEGALLPP